MPQCVEDGACGSKVLARMAWSAVSRGPALHLPAEGLPSSLHTRSVRTRRRRSASLVRARDAGLRRARDRNLVSDPDARRLGTKLVRGGAELAVRQFQARLLTSGRPSA